MDSQSQAAVVPPPPLLPAPPHAPAELHHAGFYQCISLPLEASWLGWRGLADLRLCVRRGGSADQRAAVVSAPTVFISSCLVSSLTRYSSACRAAQAQSGPAHQFRFTCWTSVNKMSTVSSSARIRGCGGGAELARPLGVGGGVKAKRSTAPSIVPLRSCTEVSERLARVKTYTHTLTHTHIHTHTLRYSNCLLAYHVNVFQPLRLIFQPFPPARTDGKLDYQTVIPCGNCSAPLTKQPL